MAPMEYAADAENANADYYPMVLVQIPMCNEREVRTCRFQIPLNTVFVN